MLQFKCQTIDITPSNPCRLMGMHDSERSKGVHNRLEASAMLFYDNKDIVVLFYCDTLFITNELKAALNEIVKKTLGITDLSKIVAVSSHTHFAPALEPQRIKLGRKDQSYYDHLINMISLLFKRLASCSFKEVYFKYNENRSNGLTCNRRRKVRTIRNYFRPFIALEPNEMGPIEEKFTIASIHEEKSNAILAVLWSFPCHPVNFPNKGLISSEFPGRVRDHIRSSECSNDACIIYLPGLAGDVRAAPPVRKSFAKLIRRTLQLSYPVYIYRFKDTIEYDLWIDALLRAFDNSMKRVYRLQVNDASISTRMIVEPLLRLGITSKEIDTITFRKIKIGDIFSMYTISAEPVSAYYNIIANLSVEERVFCTGYTDEVFGYLPTSKQIDEGGYESEGFFDSFLVQGTFTKTIETFISSNICELDAIR